MQKRKIGSITKMSEGKYRIRISCGFDDFGKRQVLQKVVNAKNDTEAERIMMEMYVNREKELTIHNSSPKTLEDLYMEWTKNHVSKLAASTQSFYAYLWNRIENKGKIKLNRLNAGNIYDILGCIPDTEKRTKSGVYKMLKAMFSKAVQWKYMVDNPCDYVDAPQYKAAEKAVLTADTAEVILTRISEEDIKYQAIFFLACTCGMRKQEIVALQWKDIDFANRTIHIRQAASHVKGKGTIIKDTKTEKSKRNLYLTDTLYYLLLQIQNAQMKRKAELYNLYNDGDFIFTQWNGEIMHISTPTHWWVKFCKRIGVEGITFHALRHTAATFMIKNNVPISTVSAVLGHSNITTTLNTYTHVIEDTKREAIQTLDNIFGIDQPAKIQRKNAI